MKKNDNLQENQDNQNKLSADASAENENNPLSQAQNSSQPEQDIEEAAPLESLLYDADDQPYERETPEESAKFQAFLSEYQALISQNLSRAKALGQSASEKKEEVQPQKATESSKKSTPSRHSRISTKSSIVSENNDWNDEITLLPENYDALDEEENIFRDTPIAEEEPESSDFSIGTENYHNEESEFQLSIKFEESAEDQPTANKENDNFKYDPEHPRFIDSIFDFVELFVITLVCVMILTTFVFKHSIVEGRSMQNTLHDGDSLIITDLFYKPERYDIVVFEDYSSSLKKAVVKRVIGLPGETVEVKINDNGDFEVYINGELLPEEYAVNTKDTTPPPTGKWLVGEGEVFVMGDNRYNSTDSRDSGVGPINIDCILGKVILRFYPFDKFGKVE